MRPAVLIPLIVFVLLGLGLAWIEYSQHSGLMLQSASADIAQLCADLKSERDCPDALRFPTRAARDPWSRPYECRATLRGLLIYTLGADAQVGGSGRDADILCLMPFTSGDSEAAEPCECGAGAEVSAWLDKP
ncbi:MAG TPA: type II secretion system protein GspG [Polyangiales bacterium]|nr:type II secretion system protein GspG [Polyangiales bacterium]